MEQVDMKLKLLSGMPMEVEGFCPIRPKTLAEIRDFGFTTYSQYLNILTSEPSKMEIFKDVTNVDMTKYTMLEIALGAGGEFLDLFIKALRFFVSEEIQQIPDAIAFGYNGNFLTNENYHAFSEVLRFQNMLKGVEKEFEYKPKNDTARRIIEKIKKAREKVKKAKEVSSKDDEVDIADIISAVSTKSFGYNKQTIWVLTLYQLYDEYNRLRMVDDYYTSIKAMIAGAEKVNLRHWSQRFKGE